MGRTARNSFESVPDKQALRERAWEALQRAKVARFPGTRGRIPNFAGAEAAAERLASAPFWRRARAVKCNPDSPQRPVRRAALASGKVLYMAVPRLAWEHPFLEIDPAALAGRDPWKASSIAGAAALGRPVRIDEMPRLDLVVTGCVAVTREGARLGKGGGYSDLEYALLREAGRIDERTPIATTVHPLQILPSGAIPMTAHDFPLDWIVTPDEIIRCRRRFRRPGGIRLDDLDEGKRASIPVLRGRRK